MRSSESQRKGSTGMQNSSRGNFGEVLKKEPWILALLAVGILLLIFPGSAKKSTAEDTATDMERRLRETLRQMDGVGEVQVLLAGGEDRRGEFTGAVVVCDGAGRAAVRLRVVQAVAAFTGLGSDKIIVEIRKS